MPEEDVLTPPETPPGDPGAVVDPPANTDPPKPAVPTFSASDVENIVTSVVSKMTPKRPEPSIDAPVGPDPAKFQTQIDELDNQIDQAVQEGKPVRQLQKARDDLMLKKYDAEYVQPLRAQGSQSINDLVLNQIAGDTELGEIFREYRGEIMDTLAPSIRQGQALRLDWVKEATRMVAGRHLTEITQRDYERRTRQAKLDTPTPQPGSTTGRSRNAPQDKQPETVREMFGERADEAFRMKRAKGHTEDTFARSLGFKDKKDWFDRDRELSENPTLGLDR